MKKLAALLALSALAACGTGEEQAESVDDLALDGDAAEENIEDVETVGPLAVSQEGATPMEERVATLGVLNKRNGLSRDVELSPGESIRVGDVMVQLRACERTAPWETQELTGAFVRVFARDTDMGGEEREWRRIFSGWLFKERPALNVVEHRIYDVFVKDCQMTWPETAPSAPAPAAASSAPSAPPAEAEAAAGSEEPAPAPSEDSAESSSEE